MSLELDLHQKIPFKTERQKGIVNIFFTSKFIEAKLQNIYRSEGVTIKQYNILRILKGADQPLTTQVIRERMIDRMSDISRIVDRMVDKGIVSKQTNVTDKRLVDVALSDEGFRILEKLNNKIDNHDHVIGCLDDQEAKELNRLLDKVRGHK